MAIGIAIGILIGAGCVAAGIGLVAWYEVRQNRP